MPRQPTSPVMQWSWDRYQNGRPSASGDMANNFKNEGHQNLDPGLFTLSPISNTARFLSREAIQNTVDASRDFQFTSVLGELPVEITFRFVELIGDKKKEFISIAGLQELESRSKYLPDGAAAKGAGTCLKALQGNTPLRLLYIEEYGASGMYGPWDDEQGTSKMSLALLSQNISEKSASAGGAFGHGKSVNAMASKIRLNIAYSCFPKHLADSGVTTRLLGVAYWPKYQIDAPRYTGFGLMGDVQASGNQQIVEPWTNEAANDVAKSLGCELRKPTIREHCGTTMLVVDPDVIPNDLKRAVERYWWPAISDKVLRVKIINYDGSTEPIRPRLDPILKTFEDAYQALRTPSGQSEETVRIKECSRVDALGVKSGDIAMSPAIARTDNDGFSKQSSLIAYIRGLGMVVKYRSINIGPPFIFGAFLSNQTSEVEALLNKAEPKTHYDWLEEPDESNAETKEKIKLLVKSINRSVSREVKDYSLSIAPPEDHRSISFRELDRELRDMINGPGSSGPTPGREDFLIRRSHPKKLAVGENHVKTTGKAYFRRIDEKIESCEVTVRYFLPNEVSRGKSLVLEIDPPSGFRKLNDDPNTFIGPCDGNEFEFRWQTPPYDSTWIGELDLEVKKHGA